MPRDDAIHPADCHCGKCDHPWPHVAQSNRFARITFAAIATGLALAFAVDRLTCGPGILCIFGL